MFDTNIHPSLWEQVSTGHALAMQCGARALRFLDRVAAGPGGVDLRASEEAVRMAGLASRLMEVLPRLRRRAGAAPAVLLLQAPDAPGPGTGRLQAGARLPRPAAYAGPAQRRGCLKNGNPAGDYLRAPRCGARTRAGCPCRQPAMANGRCRLHGGLSTGPRTPEGLARCRGARLTHGSRPRELIGLRSRAVHAARRLRALDRALSAGHGVDRPDSSSPVGARALSAAGGAPTHASRPDDLRARAARRDDSAGLTSAPFSAGHGVHRSESVEREDPEAQSGRAAQDLARSPCSAASPRRRAECPAVARAAAAGHGLHRSYRNCLRSSAAIAL